MMLPFPANRFQGMFGSVKNYEKYCNSTEFVCHVEVLLVTALAEMEQSATTLGISKAPCTLCHRYIRAVNEHLKAQGKPTWIIGAEHNKTYQWKPIDAGSLTSEKGNDAVRRYVISRVMEMIIRCAQNVQPTESPPFGFPSPFEGRRDFKKW